MQVRVKMIDGSLYMIETDMSVDQFDDKVAFGAATDFIKTPDGVRLQFSKMISHQPLEKEENE
jgi:hypothetical protein